MKKEHQEIINLISNYLEEHPSQRFGQAIFNLRINEFVNRDAPEKENYSMRDIHGDTDSDIITRIKSQLERLNSQNNS